MSKHACPPWPRCVGAVKKLFLSSSLVAQEYVIPASFQQVRPKCGASCLKKIESRLEEIDQRTFLLVSSPTRSDLPRDVIKRTKPYLTNLSSKDAVPRQTDRSEGKEHFREKETHNR